MYYLKKKCVNILELEKRTVKDHVLSKKIQNLVCC